MEATHTIITNYILGDIHLRTIQKNILRNTTIFFLYHKNLRIKIYIENIAVNQFLNMVANVVQFHLQSMKYVNMK